MRKLPVGQAIKITCLTSKWNTNIYWFCLQKERKWGL